ncbi:NAD-dependent epimerase/dehydratase family protein [Arthrobacter sp. MMS24-T111]
MVKNFVVTGAGPVGWTVAEQLAADGHRVRVVTRSGSGPDHPLVDRVAGDAKDPETLRRVFAGVDAVFHCIHGSSYTAAAWEAELPAAEHAVLNAAHEAGAVVVFPESLYSYSEPDRVMAEDSPRRAAGGKRGVRTRLLQAREDAAAATVSVAAGDFFGPRVRMAHGGERIVVPILAGRNVSVVGSANQPHSFTYVPDLAAAMVAAAANPAAWNSVWHAPTGPALTQRELVQAFARAAGVPAPKVRVLPGWALRAAALVSADMRELAELGYQFEHPFVMDSARSEAVLGIRPTPLDAAAAATVDWWRRQG